MPHSDRYLEAMGIPQWQSQTVTIKSTNHLVLVDPSFGNNGEHIFKHPIVMNVLDLLSLDFIDCQITDVPNKELNYLWDMRSAAAKELNSKICLEAKLVSDGLAMLEEGSDNKRQLWQQIVNVLDERSVNDI